MLEISWATLVCCINLHDNLPDFVGKESGSPTQSVVCIDSSQERFCPYVVTSKKAIHFNIGYTLLNRSNVKNSRILDNKPLEQAVTYCAGHATISYVCMPISHPLSPDRARVSLLVHDLHVTYLIFSISRKIISIKDKFQKKKDLRSTSNTHS
jgi:hypothetical protein